MTLSKVPEHEQWLTLHLYNRLKKTQQYVIITCSDPLVGSEIIKIIGMELLAGNFGLVIQLVVCSVRQNHSYKL